MNNLTYLGSLSDYPQVSLVMAVLFWGLLFASSMTAAARKPVLTPCLLAFAWIITLLPCWLYTHHLGDAFVSQAASSASVMARSMNFMARVPLCHVVGSMVAVALWMAIRPRTFAKPTMVALLVVLCFIGLALFEVSRAWDNYIDSANATLLNQQGPLSPEK
jgi:hypothetical protein